MFTLEAGGIAQQFGPLAEPMEPLLVKQLGSDWATAISASYQTLVADGALRAVPIGSTSAGTLLVNPTMLDSYGVGTASTETTMEEWKALCAPITADGKPAWAGRAGGLAEHRPVQSVADSYAPGKFRDAVDGKIEWTDPDLVQALTTVQSFFQDGFLPERRDRCDRRRCHQPIRHAGGGD